MTTLTTCSGLLLSEVVTLTIESHSQLYFHMYFFLFHGYNIDIALFAGIAVFAGIAELAGIALFAGVAEFTHFDVYTSLSCCAAMNRRATVNY